MEKDIKFSILMPSFNRADLLPRAIESVLNQDYKNWELVISNDGSTDSTKKIVESYMKDVRSQGRIIYTEGENAGVNIARNRALDKTTGNIITELDSDDTYFPNTLSKAKELIEKNPDGAVYSMISVPDDNHPEKNTCKFGGDKEVVFPTKEEILNGKYQGDYLKLVKAPVFDRIRYDKNIKANEGLMWKVMELSHKPVYSSTPGYQYYFSDESILRPKKPRQPENAINDLKASLKYCYLFKDFMEKSEDTSLKKELESRLGRIDKYKNELEGFPGYTKEKVQKIMDAYKNDLPTITASEVRLIKAAELSREGYLNVSREPSRENISDHQLIHSFSSIFVSRSHRVSESIKKAETQKHQVISIPQKNHEKILK